MGRSSSRSSSSSDTANQNIDQRLVTGEGSIGISGSGSAVHLADYSTTNITSVDPEIARAAFDFAKAADATGADGFNKVLGLAGDLFERGERMISQTQDRVADAYAQAGERVIDESGQISQKTMIVLALAGVGAVAIARGRK